MEHHTRVFLMSAAIVAGLAGIARAELIDPPAPPVQEAVIRDTIKVPLPRSRTQSASIHRNSTERTATTASTRQSSLRPEPTCTWFCINRYVLVVGIGF
jgi:hypothetical protein